MKITYKLDTTNEYFLDDLTVLVDASQLFQVIKISSLTLEGFNDTDMVIDIESNAETSDQQISMLWKVLKVNLLQNIKPTSMSNELINYGVENISNIHKQIELFDDFALNATSDVPDEDVISFLDKAQSYRVLENMIFEFKKRNVQISE